MNSARVKIEDSNNLFRRSSNNLVFPRLSVNLTQLPVNLQRLSTFNSISLPKLPTKSEGNILSILSSPTSRGLRSLGPSPVMKLKVPSLASSVKSSKPFGVVKYYCANTHKGLVREHNEDRVMIMLRIPKPNERKEEKWPPCSFFGLYDGHGGKLCSNFLRDYLHVYITHDPSFPNNPLQAILNGFERAENAFMELALKKKDKSGSCAVVVLIVGKRCFVANLGDSRAVMSSNCGKETMALTKDHKPNEDNEAQRIIRAGGEIYYAKLSNGLEASVGRVLPGRLAVSRTFGDIEAKIKELGGNPNVVIAVPEIRSFNITKNTDFIAIGSDGIFDRIDNNELVNLMWDAKNYDSDSLERLTKGVENVIFESMNRVSYDNVTLLAVGFEGFDGSESNN
ncbi:hypothetical protein SteCoe_36210 [Stentor coeruleus]|uniref:protein-serine/threonine phosphatase n=1 Tax=Stentor coeruleus TaxID=5963 RepID=A0A1R2AQU2_9CILI|nr:hypothetical protein SteCoe_36210 [Stentor coeruleus]